MLDSPKYLEVAVSRVGNISAQLEDYLEHIFDVIREKGIAKVSDIARLKDVKMPSVNNAINRLAREGLVTHNRYKNINLTESGARLAAELKRRHTVIRQFLEDVLGVRQSTADKDACAIEHHVHPETVRKLIDYVNNCSDS